MHEKPASIGLSTVIQSVRYHREVHLWIHLLNLGSAHKMIRRKIWAIIFSASKLRSAKQTGLSADSKNCEQELNFYPSHLHPFKGAQNRKRCDCRFVIASNTSVPRGTLRSSSSLIASQPGFTAFPTQCEARQATASTYRKPKVSRPVQIEQHQSRDYKLPVHSAARQETCCSHPRLRYRL